MRMKVIALIGLAVLLATVAPASAAALFGSGGSGSGSGDFSLGNGVVSGNFTPVGGGDTLPFENVGLNEFDFVGTVNYTGNPSGPGGGGEFEGTATAKDPVVTSEPLAFLLVGLGLVGARLIRRRA